MIVMSIARLLKLLNQSCVRSPQSRVAVWLALSLVIVAFYSLLALQQAFSADYVVQDDARQHVFWMQRWLQLDLFPNDLIADYFQSVAPVGYATVYRIAAAVGLDPVWVHKLLPLPLNLITAVFCFGVSMTLFPIPAAAFCATILLGQGLELTDAIVSGTPKAFIYPLFLAFMYYLLRRRLLPCLGAIALQGLFYPQLVFISAGTLILRLFYWRKWRPRLTFNRGDRRLIRLGLVVAFLVLLPYALQSSEFGPVISVAEARELPEFSLPGSRSRYFYDDAATFWLKGRSGLRLASALTPATNMLGLFLPILMCFPQRFPLVRRLTRGVTLLPQLLLASLVMFGAAHLLLFRLHLPSRYTQHSFRIVLSLAAGIVLVILLDAVWRWAKTNSTMTASVKVRQHFVLPRAIAAVVLTGLLGFPLLFYPSLVDVFPLTAYQIGKVPQLYTYLRSQPNDTLVASLSEEANNLPTFSGRSILVGSEYAIPYHIGYYRQFRQRATDLIRAQYSLDETVVQDFIQRYGITHWLLDRGAFRPNYVQNQRWIQQHPDEAQMAIAALQTGKPALAKTTNACTVLKPDRLLLLDAQCVSETLNSTK
jgi:hypothetical protein